MIVLMTRLALCFLVGFLNCALLGKHPCLLRVLLVEFLSLYAFLKIASWPDKLFP